MIIRLNIRTKTKYNDARLKITIISHPNSKHPRIEVDLLGQLHVYVQAPPLDGKANQAIIGSLAKHFQAKRNQVTLVQGHTSKIKVFEIGL